jgi:acyl-CoA thioesterase I
MMSNAMQGTGSPEKNLTIVAMGDSLTVGYGVAEAQAYPAQLERQLRAAGHACRVLSAGVNGEKSGEALARLGRVLALKPDLVVVQTGTNDGLRGVPPGEMHGNIDTIVRTLLAQGVAVVLAGMRNLQQRKGSYDEEFAQVYPAVAARYGVVLIPEFLAGVAGVAALNRADGIHPTAEGYGLIVRTVLPHVERALAGLAGSAEQ